MEEEPHSASWGLPWSLHPRAHAPQPQLGLQQLSYTGTNICSFSQLSRHLVPVSASTREGSILWEVGA